MEYGHGRQTTGALIVAMMFGAFPAHANGRFPRAISLVENSSDANKLVIVATYGLLVTEDRGQHWHHVCDAAFSFQTGFQADPVVAQVADGALLLGAQTSLTMSRNACDWTKVYEPETPDGGVSFASVEDFSVVAGNRNQIIAVMSTFQSGGNTVRLQESTDGGITWTPIGTPLPTALVYTIDVDPTHPMRIYATGTSASSDERAPELFLRSHDRGDTWETTAIPFTNAYASPWIAAIHPRDGNKIFVRTDAWKRKESERDQAADALLYSEDGGTTWVTLLRPGGLDHGIAGAKLLGFALSPDGSTVLAGYGDPVDPTRSIDPEHLWKGIYKSSTDGRFSFGSGAPDAPTAVFKGSVSSLTWTAKGIYAYLSPMGEPQNLIFTTDPSFAPSSLTTLMKANDVLGVSPCCRGRAATVCSWNVDCVVLGACDGGAPKGPETCEGSGGNAGTGGAAPVDSGSTGRAGSPASDGAGGGTTENAKGCGCRVPGVTTPASGKAVSLLLAGFVGAAYRKKRRAQRTPIAARPREWIPRIQLLGGGSPGSSNRKA